MNSYSIPPTQSTKPQKPWLVMHVAAVVALAIMGDSLMYSLLPLEAEGLGIPLALVGVLLSANRIIRLISNTWASLAFERWGPRLPFIIATGLTILVTLLYGVGWGFLVFLFARAGWGIAWSIFRQGGYQAVWAAPARIKGRLMGLLWGIVRLGSATSVLLGGYLYDNYGYPAAVAAVTIGASLALPLAWFVRWPVESQTKKTTKPSISTLSTWRAALDTAPRRWVMAAGFMNTLYEGVITSTLSIFLASRVVSEIAVTNLGIGTLAGVMLAMRFLANIVFGPLLGALSDKIGQALTMLILGLLSLGGISGTLNLPGIWALVCLAIVFIAGPGFFSALNAAASGLANETERPHLFIGMFTTAIDAGAAVGPLLAFSLGQLTGYGTLYLSLGTLLVAASYRFWQTSKRARE